MSTETLDSIVRRDFPAARDGDRDAYSRLVAATQRMVASVALAIVRDVQLSEDIAQDTFLTAWQRLRLLKNPDSFLPWLRQVARNRAIDQVRSRRYREASSEHFDQLVAAAAADPAAGPAAALARTQQATLLADALDTIPADSREVLVLFYREGESSRDVARLLGLSDGAVRKRLQRARDALHSELLSRIGELAAGTAPDIGFTAAVMSALALVPDPASAGSFGAAALAKFTPKTVLGVFGTLLAAISLMVGAVAIEVRMWLRRADGPVQRRALLRHGLVYGALMATYMVVLWWSVQREWSLARALLAAAGFSLAIVALAFVRARLLRRGQS